MILFLIAWWLCGVLGAGIVYAHLDATGDYTPLERRQMLGFAIIIGAVGPLGLFVSFFMTGFAYHGWRLTPRRK